ncbi:MAG: helix-turn-helix transcriptional regulator [Candidatus Fimadaptatus sp.]
MNENPLPERLAACRRAVNLTQEQVAERLNVSRQAVSRWESGAARPATERLIQLSSLYGCTLESLCGLAQSDGARAAAPAPEGAPEYVPEPVLPLRPGAWHYERVSSRTLGGLPLWHINVGPGRTARGVFALGLRARGVVAVGLLAQGVVAAGAVSLGAVALGALTLGCIALGAIAVGLVALGAIAVGALAIGALALGDYAVGALAIGRFAALGDHARADVALGFTRAAGQAFEAVGALSAAARSEALAALDGAPWYLGWARAVFALFI